jgi:hypothetical protein
MSAAPPMTPPPIEPVQPGTPESARLLNTFISPSKTFADLKRNASWWVPWVVAAVFSLVTAFVIVQKVDMEQLIRHRAEQSKFAQRQLEQATPEQREQGMRVQIVITKVQFFLRPIFSLIGALIVAAILMAIFNFGFAAEIPFKRALAVVLYAWLPIAVVRGVLLCLSLLVSGDPSSIDPDINPIATNAAFFMDRATASKFLYGIVSGFDVLAIWSIFLLGIGFAIASNNPKVTKGTTLSVLFGIYAVLILVFAGIAAAF